MRISKFKAQNLGLISGVLLTLTSLPAEAAIYTLAFNNNSTLVTPQAITSEASFDPITLYDGDTLSIVFNNVPFPTAFPRFNPGTMVKTILYGLDGDGTTNIEQAFIIAGTPYGDIHFFPATMEYLNPTFVAFQGTGSGLYFGPTWNISFHVLSGEPLELSGLTVDRIWANVALVPEPSTWAMLLIGFAGIGFATYRSRRQLPTTVMQACKRE